MRGMRDAENNQRDYGIEQKFESGLRDRAEIWIGITGLGRNFNRDYGIGQKFLSGLRDWAKIWVGIRELKNPIRDLQSKRDCQLYVQ